MNNLRKFSTFEDYEEAELVKPAVSLIADTDEVYFDQKEQEVNDKIMMAWHSPSGEASGKDIVLFNQAASDCSSYLVGLTVNGTDFGSIAILENASEPDTDYLVKYSYSADAICDVFAGDLGGGWGSSAGNVDFLIPSQITDIQSLPNNVGSLVVEALTPPTTSIGWSTFSPMIYVPDSAYEAYLTDWSGASNIHLISEYQGLLPV